jgi:hypothetical protein
MTLKVFSENMTITVCYTQQVPLKLQEYSMRVENWEKKNNKTGGEACI